MYGQDALKLMQERKERSEKNKAEIRKKIEDKKMLTHFLQQLEPTWKRQRREATVERLERLDPPVINVEDLAGAVSTNSLNSRFEKAGEKKFAKKTLDAVRKNWPAYKSFDANSATTVRQFGLHDPLRKLRSTKDAGPTSPKASEAPGSPSGGKEEGSASPRRPLYRCYTANPAQIREELDRQRFLRTQMSAPLTPLSRTGTDFNKTQHEDEHKVHYATEEAEAEARRRREIAERARLVKRALEEIDDAGDTFYDTVHNLGHNLDGPPRTNKWTRGEHEGMLTEAHRMMKEDDTLQEYIRTRREIHADLALRHHYAQLLKLKQVGQAEKALQEDWQTKRLVKQVRRSLQDLKGACRDTANIRGQYTTVLETEEMAELRKAQKR
jgi:hypothetical protein